VPEPTIEELKATIEELAHRVQVLEEEKKLIPDSLARKFLNFELKLNQIETLCADPANSTKFETRIQTLERLVDPLHEEQNALLSGFKLRLLSLESGMQEVTEVVVLIKQLASNFQRILNERTR
jgi:cell division protein FtsB